MFGSDESLFDKGEMARAWSLTVVQLREEIAALLPVHDSGQHGTSCGVGYDLMKGTPSKVRKEDLVYMYLQKL